MPGQGAPDLARDIYARAAPFLKRLRGYRNILTFGQWRTLRGQALAGDIEGAERGLETVVHRWMETGRAD